MPHRGCCTRPTTPSCQGPSAADTLGVFLAEVRRPITGVLEAGARYRVIKIKHRVYRVTPEAVDE